MQVLYTGCAALDVHKDACGRAPRLHAVPNRRPRGPFRAEPPFLRIRRKRAPEVVPPALSQASSASAADPTTGFTSSGRTLPSRGRRQLL